MELIQTAILIIFIILSIVIAFGIGSNDETFSTIYGSRTLQMKHILILTTIFAISGTLILGRNVSKTVGTGILTITITNSVVITVLISTAIWLILSSILKLPISTTHATIGSILGIGLFLGGSNSINWNTVLVMSIYWILSPIIGYFVAYFSYKIIHKLIINKLSGLRSFERAEKIFSYILIAVISINAFSRSGNDCSNAVGILTGIEAGVMDLNLALLITGIGFSLGIIVLGRGVIKNVGTLTELHPSTAFACEIPISVILFIGTLYGIPLSGSHIIVGALIGLAKARKTPTKKGLWKLILIWLLTFPASALISVIIYFPTSLIL
ncbi:MAG: inorganic phosphate transporter [Candidatus Helarchaeota archaeon]